MTVPTMEDIEQAKLDMDDINTFVGSSADTFTDNGGNNRLTLEGVINQLNSIGIMKPNKFVKLPAIYRLILNGVGTVSISVKNIDGVITENVQVYVVNGYNEQYPFFNDAYEIKATFTGTATAEVV